MEDEAGACGHLTLRGLAANRAWHNRGGGCHGPEEFVEIVPLGARELVGRHLESPHSHTGSDVLSTLPRGSDVYDMLVQSFNLRGGVPYLNRCTRRSQRRIVGAPARGKGIGYLPNACAGSYGIDDEGHELRVSLANPGRRITQAREGF
jgi:hypothetical protein